MAKDVQHEAAKAVTKLGKQSEWRKAVGELRESVKEQTRHSSRRIAYDLRGRMH
jgi:hypothetical protein